MRTDNHVECKVLYAYPRCIFIEESLEILSQRATPFIFTRNRPCHSRGIRVNVYSNVCIPRAISERHTSMSVLTIEDYLFIYSF